MLKNHFILLIALALLLTSVSGCGGSKDLTTALAPTISDIKPAKGLKKKIGIVLTHWPQGAIGREVGGLFLKTFVDALGDEDRSLELVTAADGKLPQFLSDLTAGPSVRLDAVQLAMQGRKAGYHGLVTAAVHDIRTFSEKTGIFWFRKLRYFISLTVALDVYDPISAGKIVGAVEEITFKINSQDYDAFQNNEPASIKALNDKVGDLAEDLAERVAETLGAQPWQSSVVDIRSDRFILPFGLSAGLRRGDRLAVFEARRILDGQQGEHFIVPGKRIAQIQIADIHEQMAEATGQNTDAVQVGDIVVPVK